MLALLVSGCQAYRGFKIQRLLGTSAIARPINRVVLLCVADALTYFICATSGFYALFALWTKSHGTSLAVFWALYSLLGITGKLPELLGKLDISKVR